MRKVVYVSALAVLLAVCLAAPAIGQTINGSPIVYPLSASDTTTVTIANGASLSGVAAIPPGFRLAGIVMPSAWTSAVVTFAVSASGAAGTYVPLYEGGYEYTLTEAAASRAINVDALAMYPWRYIQIRSGTSGAAVAQAGARVITLVLRPY